MNEPAITLLDKVPYMRYITYVKGKGYWVRMPKRAGGHTHFFSQCARQVGVMAGKPKALQQAVLWRDQQLKHHDQPLRQRTKEDAGVYKYNAGKGGWFAVAVWQSEDKQIKRMFSFNHYGAAAAMTLAHISRDLGTLVESDRLETV